MSKIKKYNNFLTEGKDYKEKDVHNEYLNTFEVSILFGENAVESFNNGEYDNVLDNGNIIKRKFKTEEEYKAYIMGLNDMQGNEEYVILNDEDVRNINDYDNEEPPIEIDKDGEEGED
jgi:hypothetical protein